MEFKIISYPIRTIEDCALASEQAELFCRGHKLDDKKAILVGHCVEELATNTMEHGIRPNQSIKTADIRVVIADNDVIIRLRGGGTSFDLRRYADRLKETSEPGSETGIRILINSAKDISYYRIYGMNTTIITV